MPRPSVYIIPLECAHRVMHRATGLRVSKYASESLSMNLNAFVEEIAQKAGDLARHAGRSTIREEDVLLALDMMGGKSE